MPRFNFNILHGYYAALVALPALAALFPLLAFVCWCLAALMLGSWALLYKTLSLRDEAIASGTMTIIFATATVDHLMLLGAISAPAMFFISSFFLVMAAIGHRDIQRYLKSRSTAH